MTAPDAASVPPGESAEDEVAVVAATTLELGPGDR